MTTTPSLRDTSPQGEAFGYSLTFARLPLRGDSNNVECGVALVGDRCSPLQIVLLQAKVVLWAIFWF